MRLLAFLACVGPDSERVSAWLDRHPWVFPAYLVFAVLLAAAVDGGAI